MATDEDAAKAPRRKPRKKKGVKVRIDWAFADPASDDVKFGEWEQLEAEDLEFADGSAGPDGPQVGRFTPQYYLRTLPVAEDQIAAFARDFAIERVGELRQVFALISKAIAEAERGSDWIMRWRGEDWESDESHVAAHHLAAKYVAGLLKLLSSQFWPVALDDEPERARRALAKYQRWLAAFQFGQYPKKRGAPPLAKHQAAAYVLAWAWPALTDEWPVVVVQAGVNPKRPGRESRPPPSPFHAAFLRVCELFDLGRKPDSKTLQGWLAATEQARIAHHAKLNELYGEDPQS
jgi:hypothetical protein